MSTEWIIYLLSEKYFNVVIIIIIIIIIQSIQKLLLKIINKEINLGHFTNIRICVTSFHKYNKDVVACKMDN